MAASAYIRQLRQHIGHGLIQIATASVIVLDAQQRLLMVRQAAEGRWTTPGGMVEPLESPADAALREAWEETGLHLRLTGLLGVFGGPRYRSTYANGDQAAWVATLFAAQVVGGRARADGQETNALRWIAREQIDPAECLPHVADFLRVAWQPPSDAWFDPPLWQPPG